MEISDPPIDNPGGITAFAKVLDFGPAVIDDGYIECIIGSGLAIETTFTIDQRDSVHPLNEQVPVSPGKYDLFFRSVPGVPTPEPLRGVTVLSGEVTVVAVFYEEPAKPAGAAY